MRTIHKFPLDLMGPSVQEIEIPLRNRFRHFEMQGDTPCVWAEVFDQDPKVKVEVSIIGTRHEIPRNMDYFATAMHGRFVWHLYVSPYVKVD